MSIWNHLETGLSVLQNEVIAQQKKVEAFFQEKLPEIQSAIRDVQQSTSEILSNSVPQIQDALTETFESIKESTNDIIETLQTRNNTMEHKVLMMGGRRAGKSTILASILHLLKNAPGDLCTIADLTDYTQIIIGKDGKEHKLSTLDNKRTEVIGYLKERSEKESFLVDMNPSYVNATYLLGVQTNSSSINLRFVDVPGEWMQKNVPEHTVLSEEVKASDVFVIAIDTPYLMQDDDDINEIYNRINEITDTLIGSIDIKDDAADWKQIIFCPVKCERWANEGRLDEVASKVKQAYKRLINRWVEFPNVHLWIMPIQTVGALAFYEHRDAMLYFKGEQDATGTVCGVDKNTGLVFDGKGKVFSNDSRIEPERDKRWKIDGIWIPLSWYRMCGKKYSPIHCEQPGYHILRFLVRKEDNANRMKAEAERQRLEDLRTGLFGDFLVWLKKTFNPTFGEYLPIWKQLIERLEERKLIIESGEGFERVNQTIL